MAIVNLTGDTLPALTVIGEDLTALSIEVGLTWRKGTGYAFSFDGQSSEFTFQHAGERDTNDPVSTSVVASDLCSRINTYYSSILDATVSESTVTVIAKSGNTLDVAFDIDTAALDIDSSGAVNIATSGAASDIALVTAHTAGVAFHLDADAHAGSIVDIDAGV